MPSSYSQSLRFTLQATGENNNTWGVILNQGAFQLIDSAIAGFVVIPLTGNYVLSTALGAADNARNAMLKFTGAGPYTVTIPANSKRYDIWNATTAILTVTNGSASITVQPSEVVSVVTDGNANIARVQPTDFGGKRITSVLDPISATDAATRNYVDTTAFGMAAGALPGQAGNAGLFLTTNGAAASWAATPPSGLNGQRTLAAAGTILASDREKLIRLNGTFALGFTAAATLGATFGCYLQNVSTGAITLTAPGASTIDGLASYLMYPGEVRFLFCDGTNFQTIVLNPFLKVWTASDAGFVWPPGYSAYEGAGWGAGGGGGGAGGTTTGGGGGGGGYGGPVLIPVSAVAVGATATITVGAGGAAGGTTGNGGQGGNSSIAALVTFYGGAGGGASQGAGGGGGGAFSAGSGQNGGAPRVATVDNTGAGGADGAGAASTASGFNSFYGGGGGASGNNGLSGTSPGGRSYWGGGGGGGAQQTGGAGTGGVSVLGGNGGAGTGGAGVAGSAPGGGGGGGTGSGGPFAGGAGARGEVRIWGLI